MNPLGRFQLRIFCDSMRLLQGTGKGTGKNLLLSLSGLEFMLCWKKNQLLGVVMVLPMLLCMGRCYLFNS